MPIIGEIKEASEIGYRSKKAWQKYIYHACIDCGKERWVQLHGGKPRSLRCRSCSKHGELHPLYGLKGELAAHWKGGQFFRNGYLWLLSPTMEHPRADKDGYIKRAIVVLEEKLGRPIKDGYDSHHKNGIKDDDRPENLEEREHGDHAALHLRERRERNLITTSPP